MDFPAHRVSPDDDKGVGIHTQESGWLHHARCCVDQQLLREPTPLAAAPWCLYDLVTARGVVFQCDN